MGFTGSGLSEMRELAVRLGSIVSFDRRGKVVWLDNFEDNINKWKLFAGVGANNAFALSTDKARNGAKSAKITVGDAANAYIIIGRYLPYPKLGKMGFEYSFTVNSDIKYIVLSFGLFTTTQVTDFKVRYLPQTKVLEYLARIGVPDVWTQFASGVSLMVDVLFHTWKLIGDASKSYFSELVLNEKKYDLSAYKPAITYGVDFAPSMFLTMGIYNNAAGDHSIYVDDAIVTMEEP